MSELRRNQKREPSTEGQVAVCRVRLAELSLTEGKVLVDLDRSAWNPAVKREAWDELMYRLERGVSGGVIVFDLERFSRQPKGGERMIELAASGLLVLDSESEYDLRTPNGKKAFRDAINAAAYYSDRLSTRSARGKKLKAMSGEPNGSARPFGFEADLITVREDEASIQNTRPPAWKTGGRQPGENKTTQPDFLMTVDKNRPEIGTHRLRCRGALPSHN